MMLRIEEYNLLVVTKNEITPYRVWSAATDDSGGCLDKGRESPTAGHSRICQAILNNELSQMWGEEWFMKPRYNPYIKQIHNSGENRQIQIWI